MLASLERIHQPESVRRAFDAARRAGFENVNLDLIYGAEGETPESWEATLRETVALAPEHISAYALTVEPATPLGRAVAAGERPGPDPDLQADMFGVACEVLASAGYRHYEVSNWAKPGFECRHNLGYWERRPYLGLGAGAHSYRENHRWWNIRPPEEYMAQVEAGRLPVGGEERLDPSDAYLEEVFLKLRILEGIPASWIDEEVAAPFIESGLLEDEFGRADPDRARDAAAERARAGADGVVHRLRPRCDLALDRAECYVSWTSWPIVRIWDPASPRCCAPWSRSTCAAASPSAARRSPNTRASASRAPRSATRWRPSRSSATSRTRTRARAGSRPTPATATTSTRCRRAGASARPSVARSPATSPR